MTHTERLAAAKEFRKTVLLERDSLRKQLEAKTKELTEKIGIVESLQTLAEMTHWAELTSGTTIKEGEKVRYLAKTYVCIKEHTKALTRSPINGEYWMEDKK